MDESGCTSSCWGRLNRSCRTPLSPALGDAELQRDLSPSKMDWSFGGNEEAMRYLGVILQILLGFKQAPALHSGHVLHVSSQNLLLNLCSVTFSITLLQQRLLLFFPVPSWPVLKVSTAISLGWHTENSDISTFTRGATTWIDENSVLGFSIWKEVSIKERKVPTLHPVNESPLSMCVHNSVLPWNASPERKEVN